MFKKAINYLYQQIMQHKNGIKWMLGVVIAFLMIALYNAGIFERFEYLTLDYRFMLRPQPHQASDVIFIDMAEDSIDAIGRWPWPRRWHATMIKALSEYHPKAIAFDVIFSEQQDYVDDKVLSDAIALAGNVYFPCLYDLDYSKIQNAYKGYGVFSKLDPIEDFKQNLKGSGHINAFPDSDGILRRAPVFISYDGKHTFQFGIAIARDVLGITDNDIKFDPEGHAIKFIHGGKTTTMPLDRNNELLINWKGKWGHDFKHYSYIDVLHSYSLLREGKTPPIDLNEFRSKICIIGLTATALIDIKPIPIQNAYPAVGVNAMVVNSVLNNDFVREASDSANMIIMFVVIMIATFYLCRLHILGGMALTIASSVLYSILSIAVFLLFNIAIVTFYPILGIFFSYTLTSIYTQVMQAAERARLFKQATRDGLTGLYNIRHFNLLYEAEFKDVSTYKNKQLSIIMGDLDNFKHLNDTYGHQAGDAVLQEAARSIQSRCRQTDVVARYGGEEFIVMLSGAGAKEAAMVAEKIRAAVESKKFKFKDDAYSPTISLGVVQYSNEKNKDELVGKADGALYRSKHEGKNRVSIYSSEEK